MGITHACVTFVAGLSLICLGCGDPEFSDAKIGMIGSSRQYMLSGEQVTLSQQQLDCGVENDLWFSATQVSQNRFVAQLTDKGRALKFSDDVSIGEPGFPQPYAQVNGNFDIQIGDILDKRDGESGTKTVVAKVGAKIPHVCFPDPVPIMGVKKGRFDEGTPPSILFVLHDDGWHLDKLIH